MIELGKGPTISHHKSVIIIPLPHRMPIERRVAAGYEVLQLTLDVGQECAGAYSEEVWFEPLVAQFLLHEREPIEGLLCGADAPGGLEADFVSGPLLIVPDRPRHYEADREGRVDA